MPLSEAFIERGQTVQYFKRARMVLVGGAVELSPLGLLLTADRRFMPAAPVPERIARRYFPATGHALYGDLLTFWQQHRGIAIFGPPISDPTYEQIGEACPDPWDAVSQRRRGNRGLDIRAASAHHHTQRRKA